MKTIYEFLFSEHLLKNKTSVSTQNNFVDLNLPSGLLWASCNIGASVPYERGDYFMWGSTEPSTNNECDWTRGPFNNGYHIYNKKYFEKVQNKVCPNNVLLPEYDAATVILGNNWRLPRKEDFWELRKFTIYKWEKNYLDSGVDGMLFKAKATNDGLGTELFIPSSGYKDKGTIDCKENYIFLWTTTLDTTKPWLAYTFIAHATGFNVLCNERRYGFCLRGVQ